MIIKNLFNIIKASIFQFIWMVLLISFLLFLLNILLGLSYNIENFSQEVKNKLWIYFYIKDDVDPDRVDITKVITDMKGKLEQAWLKVTYYSSIDAMAQMEKRMPEIIKNFEKYNIKNPLPPALHIVIDDNEKYDRLKSIIDEYKDFIVNIEEVSKWRTLSDQRKRIINVINLVNFLIYFSYFLIVVLIIIIMTFLMYVIKNNFHHFHKQIEVEKLVWAFYRQIKTPFLLNISLILLISFLFMMLYFSIFIDSLSDYFFKVFEMDLWTYILGNFDLLISTVFWEFIVITIITYLISDLFLTMLIRKV